MAFQEFMAKLEKAVSNMATLEIVTAVGAVSADAGKTDPAAKLMRTRVNLVDGAISTEIDPAFVAGPYAAMRDYHASREKQGAEILRSNVEVIERLFHLFGTMAGAATPPASGGA